MSLEVWMVEYFMIKLWGECVCGSVKWTTHTYTLSRGLRSGLMASGRLQQGRPSCCSFQLDTCQGAIPRSVPALIHLISYLWARNTIQQHVNTPLVLLPEGCFHWWWIIACVFGNVTGESVCSWGKTTEGSEFLLVSLKCLLRKDWECICISGWFLCMCVSGCVSGPSWPQRWSWMHSSSTACRISEEISV